MTEEQVAARDKKLSKLASTWIDRQEKKIILDAKAYNTVALQADGSTVEYPTPGVKLPKPSKYLNKKTDGYSSKKEAARAQELKLLEKAGKIRNLREQVVYELIPPQYDDFQLVERACKYIGDFSYEERRTDAKGLLCYESICEDVKGHKTEAYRIKRKLLLHVHGIRVRET